MAEVVRLFNTNEGEAILSIAVFIAVCAYPQDESRRAEVMRAFIAFLETGGFQVWTAPHPMIRRRSQPRYRGAVMSPQRRDNIIRRAAYTLLSRRLAAIHLGVFRSYRPKGLTIEKTDRAFGCGYLAAGNARLGMYRRSAEAFGSLSDPSKNVARLVWRESRPVLHLAYALRSELDRCGLAPWDWPFLAGQPDPCERVARLVRAADVWARALNGIPLGGRAGGTVQPSEQIMVTL